MSEFLSLPAEVTGMLILKVVLLSGVLLEFVPSPDGVDVVVVLWILISLLILL